MAAGRAIRLSLSTDGGTTYNVIVGSTQDNFEISREGVNITDKDDVGVQTFLDDVVGVWAMSGGVEGVLKSGAASALLPLANSNTTFTADIQIAVAGFGTYEGKYGITNFSVNGADGSDPATYSMQLTSSGTITYTAA